MKHVFASLVALVIILPSCGVKGQSKTQLKTDNDSLSYALGVSIGNSLSQGDLKNVDWDVFMAGIKDQMDSLALMEPQEADGFIRAKLQAMAAAKADVQKKAGNDWLAENKNKPGVMTTPSGLQYKVISEGTGLQPDQDDRVTVHYHGTLTDGTVFDSSVERKQPATFGLNQVIPGWTEGLQLMKAGSKYMFYIPENLAYGARAQGKIPAYSPLVFEVELISVEKVDGAQAPAPRH